MIPEIAIIGHPNEGKSSVLSTLAEDDSVRISPYPGETTQCRTFPVLIDKREILRFTDTPGFQSPSRILSELKTYEGSSEIRLEKLLRYTGAHEELAEDHQLLLPIGRGAGIIYVVDGARPIRGVDRDEMEILRLIGRPRMAVINCKQEENRYLADWKDELAKHFNSSRVFNAHRATYAERIALFEALTSIDQDWQQILTEVVDAIKKDWQARTRTTARLLSTLLTESLALELTARLKTGSDEQALRSKLIERYTKTIAELESGTHEKMRGLFKHNIFDYRLPHYSILHEELFSERTWQFLGLTRQQFILLGGIGGGVVGAGVDVAALGHGLGLFTALGALGGVLGALTGGKRLDYEASLLGIHIAGPQIKIGPAGTISLLFVLINRALLFYQHVANWAHGRRDYSEQNSFPSHTDNPSFTKSWSAQQLKCCHGFFKSAAQPDSEKHQAYVTEMQEILISALQGISEHDS